MCKQTLQDQTQEGTQISFHRPKRSMPSASGEAAAQTEETKLGKDRMAGKEVSLSATVNKHYIIKSIEFPAALQTCWQTATVLTRQLQSTEGV